MILYQEVSQGIFLERPNRFIARVQLDNSHIVIVHVANTGRCSELLIPGVAVILAWFKENTKRKTPATLVAVYKDNQWINIDSQAPNKLVGEYLNQGNLLPGIPGPYNRLRKEVTLGDSRFDFAFHGVDDKPVWVEVKGVTLKEGHKALFPDAPTLRGLRHIKELTQLSEEARGVVLFVLQMQNIKSFSPNKKTQPAFAAELLRAQESGVKILAWQCRVEPQSLEFLDSNRDVPIEL